MHALRSTFHPEANYPEKLNPGPGQNTEAGIERSWPRMPPEPGPAGTRRETGRQGWCGDCWSPRPGQNGPWPASIISTSPTSVAAELRAGFEPGTPEAWRRLTSCPRGALPAGWGPCAERSWPVCCQPGSPWTGAGGTQPGIPPWKSIIIRLNITFQKSL